MKTLREILREQFNIEQPFSIDFPPTPGFYQIEAALLDWAKAYGEQVRKAMERDIEAGLVNCIETDRAPLLWARVMIKSMPLPEPS